MRLTSRPSVWRLRLSLVFAPLKRLFKRDDPANTVSDEVVDVITRYQRSNEQDRKTVISAFGFARARVEIEYGEIDTWGFERKRRVAKALLEAAKEGYAHAAHSSCGIALMGLFLEAQTIPGDKAERLVYLIEEWHRRAVS
jgi:hypothetical protein